MRHLESSSNGDFLPRSQYSVMVAIIYKKIWNILSKKDNFKLVCSKMHEVPLVLSAFTHLWNPIGFSGLWVVKGQYMHRTMHILEGLGHHHEQSSIYPHPYFGQYFLAGMLPVVGYPESLNLSSTTNGDMINSIKMLYLVPRVFMGVLAVFDTFYI